MVRLVSVNEPVSGVLGTTRTVPPTEGDADMPTIVKNACAGLLVTPG